MGVWKNGQAVEGAKELGKKKTKIKHEKVLLLNDCDSLDFLLDLEISDNCNDQSWNLEMETGVCFSKHICQ